MGSIFSHSHQQNRYLDQQKYSPRRLCFVVLLKSCKKYISKLLVVIRLIEHCSSGDMYKVVSLNYQNPHFQ